MENKIQDVYRRFGEKFCICPFLGGFYRSHGIVNKGQNISNSEIKPCCVTYKTHDREFDIVENSIEKSINQPVWLNMRKAFAQGEYESIPQCKACHNAEKAGSNAIRFGANLHFATNCHDINLVEEIQKVIDNDFHVNQLLSIDWFPSNYCNYSCVMCSGGASSQRLAFENIVFKRHKQILLNDLALDFQKYLNGAKVINFTGGETILQPQILETIEQLAADASAKNKTIFILTNGSSFPDELIDNFKKFHRVIYMVSIDGVGAVGEYQRRNSKWSTVETNALRLLKNEFIATVINCVLTGVNVLKFMEFVDWVYNNQITNGITISQVLHVEYLGMTCLPNDLRASALQNLSNGLKKYINCDNAWGRRCVEIIKTATSIIESSQFNANHHKKFIWHIKKEDAFSVTPFTDVVTEWRPYFNSQT